MKLHAVFANGDTITGVSQILIAVDCSTAATLNELLLNAVIAEKTSICTLAVLQQVQLHMTLRAVHWPQPHTFSAQINIIYAKDVVFTRNALATITAYGGQRLFFVY
jgi:hypothetical protein